MGKSLLSKKSLFRLTAELDSPWFAVYFSLAVLFCWVAAVSEDARRALDICWQAKELAQVRRTDQQRRGTGGDVPCQLCRKGVVCFLISLPTCVYYLGCFTSSSSFHFFIFFFGGGGGAANCFRSFSHSKHAVAECCFPNNQLEQYSQEPSTMEY